jgi:radical SAM protein with 4Fe4S-binding SPASM domain
MEDCGGIPQLGYGEFSEWLHRRVGNQHIPIYGSLEVTMHCNLRCQHCYIPIKQRRDQKDRELSQAEIEHILDEITDAGCLWLLLTGGEPFLRRDFLEIYTYAKRKGLILTIFTNGTLITKRISDYLAEWRPFNIEITLYGATQETYERVTGIKGSYTRCRRGIDLLLERNLPLGLKTVVMTLNHHELDEMKALANSLGVQFRFDPILNPALDGSARPTSLRLSPEELVAIEKSDPDRASRWPKTIQENLMKKIQDTNLFYCSAGKNSFHVDASGHLSMCISARNPIYNLRNGSFKEIWENLLPQAISRQYSDQFVCADCHLRLICAQCPALSELECQDAEARVEYLCQVTNLRYKAFGAEY